MPWRIAMTRMRCFSGPEPRSGAALWSLHGQFQGESGALADATAVCGQRSAQLRGRQRATVKAEAVAVLAGRKTVVENAGQVFRWNPNAIVNDGDGNPLITLGDLEPDLLVLPPRFVTGILGI